MPRAGAGVKIFVVAEKMLVRTKNRSVKQKGINHMKYLKEIAIIFGITMMGEVLNELIPLPVPAGVYGLFILLGLLCTKIVKLADVAATGNLLLDMMPLMFVPAAVGLLEKYQELTSILVPFVLISAVSTLIVMAVTGKTTEFILHHQKKEDK